MVKAEQAPKSADVAGGPQSPIRLEVVYVTGAIWHGVAVKSLRIELMNGDVQRIKLRTPHLAGGLSARKVRIMEVLGESPVPLTRLAVAHRCNLEDATGRFGRDLKELIESDALVYTHGQDVTDDPAKFSVG